MPTDSPKVSILCLTYNQEEYIKQALDGFLMQKTSFDFEVLINDDASTDKTVEILKQYQRKYPNVIKLNLQKENQYSKGKRNMIIRYLLPKAKGEYLALCEGDDYWTDSSKLQRQVDFLEKRPDHTLCFHPVRVVDETRSEEDYLFPRKKENFTQEGLLRRNFIQTNSVLYRKLKYENMSTDVMPGDWYLHLYHARFGKIGYIDKVMAVYRRHPGGIWWNSNKKREEIWKKHGIAHMALYLKLLEMYGDSQAHTQIIYVLIKDMLKNIIDTDEGCRDGLLTQLLEKLPGHEDKFILAQHFALNKAEEVIASNKSTAVELREAIERRNVKIKSLEADIESIKSSQTWRLASLLNRMKSMVVRPVKSAKSTPKR